ncbi:hypothetical protein BGW41_005653 [Actinomortierella wolfii]|nr:hypothetical protein BGW41_005653 [Actinomortierella wolfii]
MYVRYLDICTENMCQYRKMYRYQSLPHELHCASRQLLEVKLYDFELVTVKAIMASQSTGVPKHSVDSGTYALGTATWENPTNFTQPFRGEANEAALVDLIKKGTR